MLRSLKKLEHYKVSAVDGDVGRVVNFLMDDERWAVRYLVVETGGFLSGRKVLITPIAFREVDFSANRFRLSLTIDKVKNSPSVNLNLPVSRQHERDYCAYYGYPYYWGSGAVWGMGNFPGAMATFAASTAGVSQDRPGEPPPDVHLRSARDVTGYHVEATDGAIGHVDDFVVDDGTWEVRYVVVATTNWWPGKKVLIAPEWATRISWTDRKMYLGMTRDAIMGSPEWGGRHPIDREYEELLRRHYAGTHGWSGRDRSFTANAGVAKR